MEPNVIVDPIRRYFETLAYTGFTSTSDYKALLLLIFLYNYVNHMIEAGVPISTYKIRKFYNCLYKQSCFINQRLASICVTEDTNHGFTYTFNFRLS